jgi:fengycin family lipopeptide synthetase D
MSYKDLNEKSNQLAHLLVQKGVKPDTIVGIRMERSIEMIIGILGILKSDGAYLPIDMEYPPERIKYMLEDSSASVLINTGTLAKAIEGKKNLGIVSLNFSTLLPFHPSTLPSFHLHLTPAPAPVTSLAYIIYTSGSTGKPKGVMVEHSSLVNLALSCKTRYQIDENERLLQLSSICFDASVEQIFPALISGSVLVIIKKEVILDAARFHAFLIHHSITHLDTVPSILNLLPVKNTYPFKRIISGGEACPVSLARKWSDLYDFYNVYGPTETTVTALDQKISGIEASTSRVPVGKPIANVNVYILDLWEKPVPLLVTGELCIGGSGTARGYLNQPQLTAEKFVHYLPIQPCSHAAMQLSPHPSPLYPIYRTGDLARWLPDGNIEFLGRIDHQVKIRGYRVELGEIESRLLSHAEIKEALVVTKEETASDQQYLASYIVGVKEFNVSELRRYLELELPAYMIPSYFVQIETFPLTANGKIDVKALPEPGPVSGQSDIAPRNEIEKKLAGIWAEVLGTNQQIGIDDNFFQLGGHSLKATIVVSRIHKELNIHVPLAEIFKSSTIRKLAEYISGTAEEKYESIRPVEAKEYYELSSAQKRLYLLQQMELNLTAYNMPEIIPLTSQPDRGKLEKTFIQLIQRHESLRTSFHMVKDIPVQKVHDTVEFALELTDAHDYHDFLKSFVRPFDLAKAPLLRVGLIVPQHTPAALPGHPRRGTYNSQEGIEDRFLLMVDMHHIISDGMSHEVLVKDFMVLNEDKELPPPLRIQYKDFSQWQNSEKEKEKIKRQELYWLQEFKGEIPVLNIPTDYNRPVIQSFEGNTVSFEISANEASVLKTIALKEKMTLYMVLLAIFNVLLAKLSNQEDIVIGTPIAGRRHTDLDNIIGMFVNTLALRNYPKGEKNFNDFLIEVKQRTLEAFENQECQFEDLVDKVEVERDASRNPLFDIMFAKHNINVDELKTLEPGGTPGEKQDSKQEPRQDIYTSSKFDMTLTVLESKQKPAFTVTYNTALFKKETIEIFIGYFKRIISSITINIETKLSQIEIMSKEEKRQLVYDFNDTKADSHGDKTIHRLFEEQVEKTADHIGVVDLSHHLTYGELNNKSNRLARLVKRKGVGPGNIAAIITHPTQEMLVGIMGVLKAGACYLPIDPANPPARISYMLMDSETKLVLIQEGLADDIKDYAGEILKIHDGSLYKGESPADVQNHNPADPLYMIYTSGTTGIPKGVMVKHENLVNYVIWFSGTAGLTSKDKTVLTSSFSFDLGYTSLYPSILKGGQIHLLPKETYMIPEALLDYIQLHHITYLKMTPSLFSPIVEDPYFSAEICRCLRLLVLGGEPIDVSDVEKALCICTHLQVMNHYGPTEVTIGCIAQLINIHNWEAFRARPTIGKPIRNINVFILDKYLNLLPIKIAGELYLGGAGVAKGYFKRESLTAEKFIPLETAAWSTALPPTPVPGNEIIYCTGDQARWLPDGYIEFLGRVDQQVKIRGYRIELGEIESLLQRHGEIRECVVEPGVDERENRYLCAYIVPARKFEMQELREYLLEELPEYMVPSYFIQLDKIPLTLNGKVDRKALPPMGIIPGTAYTAPADRVEERLVELWSEVLFAGEAMPASASRPQLIGTHDNFFELGGHSLKAIILLSKIQKAFNVKIPLAMMFRTPTIKGLSANIIETDKDRFIHIMPVEKKEYYILSSAQKRLYILQQMEPGSTAYNIPIIIPLTADIDIKRLQGIFLQLIKRHESLRTSFHMMENEPVFKVYEPGEIEFSIEYISLLEGPESFRAAPGPSPQTGNRDTRFMPTKGPVIKFYQKAFDLTQAPLLKVGILETKEGEYTLLMVIHHIISDRLTRNILQKEFNALYEGKEIPPLRIQYNDFSGWQHAEKQKEYLNRQERYWLRQYEDKIPELDLPTDYPRPEVQLFAGNILHDEIPCDTEALRTMALENKATVFMLFLAIFNIFLSKVSGQEDIVVGTPVAGRRHADLEGIVGLFVNTLALRNKPKREKTFTTFLQEVKETTLEAFDNQDYQFEDLVEKLAVKRDKHNPIFDVMFTCHDQRTDSADDTDLKHKKTRDETKINIPKASKKQTLDENNLETSKFDLYLNVVVGKTLGFSFEYSTELFRAETIQTFAKAFKEIVLSAIANKNIKLENITITTTFLKADLKQVQDELAELEF